MIDFSIAQKLKKKRGWDWMRVKKRSIQGTRSYMAPEQIRRIPLDVTADIYSFGCVLHELMTGKPPFSGASPNDLLNKHLRSQPPNMQAVNRAVSDKFADLVLRMLEKEPRRRPQSFKDFLTEYDRLSVYKAGLRPRATS